MAIDTDKNSYTIIFAIVMAVIVGGLLALFAEFTKEKRRDNEKTAIMQNILFAVNVQEEDGTKISRTDAMKLFTNNIKEQYVIVDNKAVKDSNAYLIEVKKEVDQAKTKKNYKRKLPFFVADKKGKKLYVIPMRGVGLWGPIWGYLAVNEDFKTLGGVYFGHQAETPGLGSKITEPAFYDDFIGESFIDSKGKIAGIDVSKSNGDPSNKDKDDNQVDAITGATITGNGVASMMKESLKLYAPYFKTLKK